MDSWIVAWATPVALSANYISAPDPGDVQLTAILRRAGRQVSIVDVVLSQGDRTAVACSVTLGSLDLAPPRHVEPLRVMAMPAEPPADAVAVTPDHPIGQVVHVATGYELRMDAVTTLFLEGKQGAPVHQLWVRPLDGDVEDAATAALFAIMAADISPPVTMNRGIFGWAPTVQLTTYLRGLPAPGWLRVVASSTVVGDTWFEEDHAIVDSGGNVVVQSRQLAMLPKQST